MRKTIIPIMIVAALTLSMPVAAQDVKVSIKADSTFNPADVEAKTFKGFDVDTAKVNTINMALQIASDVAVFSTNDKEVSDAFPFTAYYRQRADWILSSALPEHTNMYSTVTFLNIEEGLNSEAMVVITNLEMEHFFKNKRMKFRIGRLCNTVSESQFFGRIALEESSAHQHGRKIFINDAIEWDGRFKNGTGVYFVGAKPVFKPLNWKGFYAGMHQPFKNKMQMHAILSVNRVDEDNLKNLFTSYSQGDVIYYSYEAEVAHKGRTTTVFLNAGGNIGSVGMIPHTSGTFDILKQSRAYVPYKNKDDAWKETFMTSAGFRMYPSRINPKCKIRQFGLEAEAQGLLSDRFTSINACAYCVMSLTRRMILAYYCTPQFVWQEINPKRADYMAGVVNFLRLSVTVGKPGRMFM